MSHLSLCISIMPVSGSRNMFSECVVQNVIIDHHSKLWEWQNIFQLLYFLESINLVLVVSVNIHCGFQCFQIICLKALHTTYDWCILFILFVGWSCSWLIILVGLFCNLLNLYILLVQTHSLFQIHNSFKLTSFKLISFKLTSFKTILFTSDVSLSSEATKQRPKKIVEQLRFVLKGRPSKWLARDDLFECAVATIERTSEGGWRKKTILLRRVWNTWRRLMISFSFLPSEGC